MTTRLQHQIEFILEIDKLKQVLRRSHLISGERLENSAEHSWHIAVMAMLLAEHANEPVDLLRVIKMLLIHDIVEIDAGDTYVYDQEATAFKAERERQAAGRLFGMLPEEQEQEFHQLWAEFEARATPEAKFANALDRLIPLLHSYHNRGRNWRTNAVIRDQVFNLNRSIDDGSRDLWAFAQSIIDDAVAQGYLSVTQDLPSS